MVLLCRHQKCVFLLGILHILKSMGKFLRLLHTNEIHPIYTIHVLRELILCKSYIVLDPNPCSCAMWSVLPLAKYTALDLEILFAFVFLLHVFLPLLFYTRALLLFP